MGKKDKKKTSEPAPPTKEEVLYTALTSGGVVSDETLDGTDVDGWREPDTNANYLIVAVKHSCTPETLRLVAAKTVDVNYIDVDGNTALHHAAKSGQADLVGALLELGANKAATNGPGVTAEALAREHGHEDVANTINPPVGKESKKEKKAREKREADEKKKREEEDKKRVKEAAEAEEARKKSEAEAAPLMAAAPESPAKKSMSNVGDRKTSLDEPHSPGADKRTSTSANPLKNTLQSQLLSRTGSAVMPSAAAADGGLQQRKPLGKLEEITRRATEGAGKIVAANISRGITLMQIHVYGIGFIRSVRENLYWMSMGDLILTIMAFTVLYTSFMSYASYNMIWLSVLHWPRSILGLLLIPHVPKYEKISPLIMSVVGDGNLTTAEALSKLKAYLKGKMSKSKKVLIPWIICSLLTLVLDALSLLVLLWGHFDETDAYTFVTMIVLAFLFFDLYILFWWPTVKYGLPDKLYNTFKNEFATWKTETSHGIKARLSRSKSSAEPGADLEAELMEEGMAELPSPVSPIDKDEITLD